MGDGRRGRVKGSVERKLRRWRLGSSAERSRAAGDDALSDDVAGGEAGVGDVSAVGGQVSVTSAGWQV